ncbi:MAG: ferrochelatase [Bacteroidota bacterium]|nr:ferrochelatase [Bacteroidota bacterium]
MKRKKIGVLLLNLGTPDSPSVKDVRVYLREFLNDPRVIDINPIARLILVNLIIVTFRAPKSAKEYKKLFKIGNGKSPLLTYGKNLTSKVGSLSNNDYTVELAMRYGNPSMDEVLARMRVENYDQIYLFPLYPQYASASTGSTIEKAFRIINKWWVIPEVRVIGQFYNHPEFVQCILNRANKFDLSKYDHIVFSYHGIPERHVDKVYLDGKPCADHSCESEINDDNTHCYKAACYATTRIIADKLKLEPSKHSTCFQSRLGRDPWLVPYTDDVIENLGKKGNKKVLVFSPAFVADCLETTIEISEEYLELFEENGGEQLDLVPSLNDDDDWAKSLDAIIRSSFSN